MFVLLIGLQFPTIILISTIKIGILLEILRSIPVTSAEYLLLFWSLPNGSPISESNNFKYVDGTVRPTRYVVQM